MVVDLVASFVSVADVLKDTVMLKDSDNDGDVDVDRWYVDDFVRHLDSGLVADRDLETLFDFVTSIDGVIDTEGVMDEDFDLVELRIRLTVTLIDELRVPDVVTA